MYRLSPTYYVDFVDDLNRIKLANTPQNDTYILDGKEYVGKPDLEWGDICLIGETHAIYCMESSKWGVAHCECSPIKIVTEEEYNEITETDEETIYIINHGVDGELKFGKQVWKGLTFEATDYVSFGYEPSNVTMCQYSFDGDDWYDLNGNFDLMPGEKIYLRGEVSGNQNEHSDNEYYGSGSGSGSDSGMFGQFYVWNGSGIFSGNINSMLQLEGWEDITEIPYPYSFYSLFGNCNASFGNLLLPCTTLNEYCYGRLFSQDATITKELVLPATTLNEGCYYNMFNGTRFYDENRSEFNDAICGDITLYAETYNEDYFGDWSCFGSNWDSFIRIHKPTSCHFPLKENFVFDDDFEIINHYDGLKITALEDSVIMYDNLGVLSPMFYTKDNLTWKTLTNEGITLQAGETIGLKRDSSSFYNCYNYSDSDIDQFFNNYYNNDRIFNSFIIQGGVEVSGDIISVGAGVVKGNFNEGYVVQDLSLVAFFANCDVIDASNLHIGTYVLDGDFTLMSLFENCTKLISAPKVISADYCGSYSMSNMFYGCINLVNTPSLYITESGYATFENMFANCMNISDVKIFNLYSEDSSIFTGLDTIEKPCVFKIAISDMLKIMDEDYSPEMIDEFVSMIQQQFPSNWTVEDYSMMMNDFNGLRMYNQTDDYVVIHVPDANGGYVEYSSDNINWTRIESNNNVCVRVDVNVIGIRGVMVTDGTYINNVYNGNSAIYGNIMSVYDASNFETNKIISIPYAFDNFFLNCGGHAMFMLDSKHNLKITLPATTLSEGCYYGLFHEAYFMWRNEDNDFIELPATNLSDYCYSFMFQDSNIQHIKVSGTTCDNNEFDNWLLNCVEHGTIDKPEELNLPLYSQSGVPNGWNGLNFLDDYEGLVLTFQEYGNLRIIPSNSCNGIYFTINGQGWNYIDSSMSSSIGVNAGDKVGIISMSNDNAVSTSSYMRIWTATKHTIKGNLMSLVYGDVNDMNSFKTHRVFKKERQFYRLFQDNTGMIDASEMYFGSVEMNNRCCYEMFSGCTSLQYAPVIEATVANNYCCNGMFWNCTSLRECPVLNFTTINEGALFRMFQGCSSLTETCVFPTNVTFIGGRQFYGMFGGCRNLTTVHTLPYETILNSMCAEMFSYCNSLVNMPLIEAKFVHDYGCEYMFAGCTSLKNLTTLNITDVGFKGLEEMFSSCNSLTSTVDMPLLTNLGTESCYNMYKDCVNLTDAHDLVCETLGIRSYTYMFNGCTSLEKSPIIHANTFNSGSMLYMFNGCTSLNEITLTTNNPISSEITLNWCLNVATGGTVYCSSKCGLIIDSPSGIPVTWTRKILLNVIKV